MTTRPGSPEYYEDAAGEVRWRVRDANGEITEASSEGFVDLRNAFDNYTLTRANVQVSYEEAQEQFSGYEPHVHTQNIGLTGHDASNDGEEEDSDAAEEGAGGTGDLGVGAEDEDEESLDSSAADEGRA